MKLIYLTSEFDGHKVGGLHDFSSAFVKALSKNGTDVRPVLFGMPQYMDILSHKKSSGQFRILGRDIEVIEGQTDYGATVYAICNDELYGNREGNIYGGPHGEWHDFNLRFAVQNIISVAIAEHGVPRNSQGWKPQVIHGQDFFGGLFPALLKSRGSNVKSVFTIHNTRADSGVGSKPLHIGEVESFGLSRSFIGEEVFVQHDHVSQMALGVTFADAVTTVSKAYAEEIKSPQFGFDLTRFYQSRDVVGILNGIEADMWTPMRANPSTTLYNKNSLELRAKNTAKLRQAFGLVESDGPIFSSLHRLDDFQKGTRLLFNAVPQIVEAGGQLVLHGQGDPVLAAEAEALQNRYPGNVSAVIGYNEDIAHLMLSGAHVMVSPSHFEPCGLTNQYALTYGCLPLVRNVGGLKDTVVNTTLKTIEDKSANGFVFEEPSSDALFRSAKQAIDIFKLNKPLWKQLQLNAMSRDFGWDNAIIPYKDLYRSLVPQTTTKYAS